MTRKITIALVQLACSPEPDANREKAMRLVGEAAGAQVICLPELFPYPWFLQEERREPFRWAEPLADGPTVTAMADLARRREVTIVAPFYERAASGIYYDSAALLGPDGTLLGLYRKNHIPEEPGYHEKFYYRPGNTGFPVFDTGDVHIGVQICWDNMFPEGSRILGLKGVEVIFAPRATQAKTRERWRATLVGNALANGCFVATANRTGRDGILEFGGDSLVVDPDGQIIAQASEEDEALVVELDLEQVWQARHAWPYYRDRRPEIYGEIAAEPLPKITGE
jgi:predicted amidohydrolase